MAAVVVGDGWSSTTTDCTNVITLRPLHTHNTAAHAGLQVSSFQCLWLWLSVWAKKENTVFQECRHECFFKNCCTFENEILPEHFIHVHSGQPEAVRVAVIIAGASTVALDERRGAELLQTGAGRGESLTWALSTCTGVLLHRETEQSKVNKDVNNEESFKKASLYSSCFHFNKNSDLKTYQIVLPSKKYYG